MRLACTAHPGEAHRAWTRAGYRLRMTTWDAPAALRARGVLVALVAIGATSLAGCAPTASGAESLAEAYVDLVATGDADDLETLWAMTSSDAAGARTAGQLLLTATTRIEVLEVGDASPAEDASSGGLGSDLVPWEAVQVPVRYELDGQEHEGTVVLAPFEDAARESPESWRVVGPLMGGLQLAATGFAGLVADAYVGGERLVVDREFAGDAVALYPGVYAAQLRGDPYLASEEGAVTVVAGSDVAFPDLALGATDDGEAALQQRSDAFFAECGARIVDCPMELYDAVAALDAPYPWTSRLVAAPTVVVDGWTVTLEGGAIEVQDVGGPVTFAFSGTGPWVIDNQSWSPYVSTWDLDLQVTS